MRFGVSAAAAEIGLALFLAVVVSGGAAAQSSYPEKAVRIITNAPASLPDNVVRVVGQKLSELWGKPVVIENVAGAAGNVAAERVAKSAPDGHTLLFIGDAAVTTNVALYQSMPYDPLKDFAPVSMVADSVNILVVHPEVPAKSVAELVALAKAQPGKITFASAGLGTSQHLGGELLKSMAGIDILHVPYKGMGPLLPDLLSGRVMMQFGNISTFLPLIREGKVRGIAVSSLKRAPQVPDLPTMDESGFPGFAVTAWVGALAPAGTPEAIVAKIHQDIVHVLAMPDLRDKMMDMGFIIGGTTPQAFAAQIKSEIETKGKLVRDSGAKPQ